jgi:hypothetical protein
MTTPRIRVSDLDFTSIKDALKLHLKETPEFNSVDYEGSNINVLLDILAYNTHYQSLTANMISNEMFMDSAVKRSSIVSHAKTLGYMPYSNKASEVALNLIISTESPTIDSLYLPLGTRFSGSNEIGSFFFTNTEQYQVDRQGTGPYFYDFGAIPLKQGAYSSETLNYSHVYPYIEISNSNIDLNTLIVRAVYTDPDGQESLVNFSKATSFLDLDKDSLVYFTQEGFNGTYSIYFGDGVIGYKPGNSTPVYIEYVATVGSIANNCNDFSVASPFYGTGFSVSSISNVTKSFGGRDRETTESIKFNALNYFGSQDRAVVAGDYRALISQFSPNVKSVLAWGGEENIPVKYGKVLFCVIPQFGARLTQQEKDSIVAFIKPKAVANVQFEFVDPDYIDLELNIDVSYNRKKITSSTDNLTSAIRNTTLEFANTELLSFGGVFHQSKLLRLIDTADAAIIGSSMKVKIVKELSPSLFADNTFQINFSGGISKTQVDYSVVSSKFTIPGFNSRVFLADDKNGVLNLMYQLNGVDYIKSYGIGSVDYINGQIKVNSLIISDYSSEFLMISVYPNSSVISSSKNVVVRIQNKYITINKIPEG